VQRRGFTIVELLVSISVIGVLLAITLPAIRRVRESALELAVVNHQRQVMAELTRHAVDHEDFFPHYAGPGAADARLDYPLNDSNTRGLGTVTPENGGYWGQPNFWWWVLERDGYGGMLAMTGPEVDPAFVTDIALVFAPIARDTLTYTAFAKDALFASPPRIDVVALRTPRRMMEVAFPSEKGVLMRANRAREGEFRAVPPIVSFADGSASAVAWDRFLPAAGVYQLVGPEGLPVLTTRGGLGGRDVAGR